MFELYTKYDFFCQDINIIHLMRKIASNLIFLGGGPARPQNAINNTGRLAENNFHCQLKKKPEREK